MHCLHPTGVCIPPIHKPPPTYFCHVHMPKNLFCKTRRNVLFNSANQNGRGRLFVIRLPLLPSLRQELTFGPNCCQEDTLHHQRACIDAIGRSLLPSNLWENTNSILCHRMYLSGLVVWIVPLSWQNTNSILCQRTYEKGLVVELCHLEADCWWRKNPINVSEIILFSTSIYYCFQNSIILVLMSNFFITVRLTTGYDTQF